MNGASEIQRFSRIRLRNWKNFAACEATVAGRVFLVGPNASGKSNFLDAFRFLRDLALPGGGFQKATLDRGGVRAIRCLAARRSDPHVWEYELAFNQDQQRRARVTREMVKYRGEVLLS